MVQLGQHKDFRSLWASYVIELSRPEQFRVFFWTQCVVLQSNIEALAQKTCNSFPIPDLVFA